MHACLCRTCIPVVHGGQKRAMESLELGQLGMGIKAGSYRRSDSVLKLQDIFLVPQSYFLDDHFKVFLLAVIFLNIKLRFFLFYLELMDSKISFSVDINLSLFSCSISLLYVENNH